MRVFGIPEPLHREVPVIPGQTFTLTAARDVADLDHGVHDPTRGPSMIAIPPRCVSRPGDDIYLYPFQAVLDTDAARQIGLDAFAQCYQLSPGQVRATGDPVLLRRVSTGQVKIVDPGDLELEEPSRSGDLRRSIADVQSIIQKLRVPDELNEDMLYVTSDKLWLIATPRVILMQADDIAKELRAISMAIPDLTNSVWASATMATLRYAEASSAHERLTLVEAAQDGIAFLEHFRAESMMHARDHGYSLRPFASTDLEPTRSTA